MDSKYLIFLFLIFLLLPAQASMVIAGNVMDDSFWYRDGTAYADLLTSGILVTASADHLVAAAPTNGPLKLACRIAGEVNYFEVLSAKITPRVVGSKPARINQSDLCRSYPGMDVYKSNGTASIVHFYDLNAVVLEDDSILLIKSPAIGARWDIELRFPDNENQTIRGADGHVEIVKVVSYGYVKK